MRTGRTHASQLLGLVFAAAIPLMLSGAQAQAPLSTFKDCDACPEMVALPPGKFLMGASKADAKLVDPYTLASELPQHEVTIGYSFAIGKGEVTVDEFAAYVAETGAKTGGVCQLRLPEFGPNRGKFIGTAKPGPTDYPPALVTIADGDFRTPGAQVSGDHPATCISRREAQAYLDWLGKKSGKAYRFPTEAEWEYAVRAGSATPLHYGGGLKDLCKYGNFADKASPYNARMVAQCAEKPSPERTTVAGSYLPNAWGLDNMIGNAFHRRLRLGELSGRAGRRLAVAPWRLRKLHHAQLFLRQHGDRLALGSALPGGRPRRPKQRPCASCHGVARRCRLGPQIGWPGVRQFGPSESLVAPSSRLKRRGSTNFSLSAASPSPA
jgi:formylglycine-generating enzyme required for sulfatase activity